MKRYHLLALAALAALAVLASLLAAPVVAQAGQVPDIGDLFGDLVRILRDPVSGQPILAQRWVELPASVLGYGWGYCPVPIDEFGWEIAFVPYTCDAIDPTAVVAVDEFGRLNSSRTTERNSRMHFDEVIVAMKSAEWVDLDGSARLTLGSGCVQVMSTMECETWAVVDSPMQNLGLFRRLMKYGHIQTDPEELDLDWHGDPEADLVYHPALDPGDWGRMAARVRHLLPGNGNAVCFNGDDFVAQCGEEESLDSNDLVTAAAAMAGAADKSGRLGVDVTQYLGRFMRITQATDTTPATLATLPALVRDCWPSAEDPPDPAEDDPAPVDPPYLPAEQCDIFSAHSGLPNFDLFYEVSERFVDFSAIDYVRAEWRSNLVEVILPAGEGLWQLEPQCPMIPWLEYSNGPDGPVDIEGFVLAANDSLRWIEFVHNYEVPVDLFATETLFLIFGDDFESGDTSAWSAATQNAIRLIQQIWK